MNKDVPFTQNLEEIVTTTLNKFNNQIVLGTPLGLGKANRIVNAFYDRAKVNSQINLKIFTALTLSRPKFSSEIEKNFLEPFYERVFGDYPELSYEKDREMQTVPSNIQIVEFYYPAGKYVNNSYAQRNYISSNYTHVVRDMLDHGVNVLAQLVCHDSNPQFVSMSCNSDVTMELYEELKRQNREVSFLGELNENLPYFYDEAEVNIRHFDFIYNAPKHFQLFGIPKETMSNQDYAIGIHASTLILDGGELQIGIGSLGDGLVYSLKLRHEQNSVYQSVIKNFKVEENFLTKFPKIWDLNPFKSGIFSATEMLVDGFIHLMTAGILKKEVYDDPSIQRLLNEGKISENVNQYTLDRLIEVGAIRTNLNEQDVIYLQKFGVFKEKPEVSFSNGKIQLVNGKTISADLSDLSARSEICQYCLNEDLKGGSFLHAGFFIGPKSFYEDLKNLPENIRRKIQMKSISKVNQLYGHEKIDRLHRGKARFVNTGLKASIFGAVCSDALENGKIVSGVGGQYNFVSQAHALPDGRSILQIRSYRGSGKNFESNIVYSYGHTTISRHLRDIIITEYGIALLRGKTDEECAIAMLNISDSRAQNQLLMAAKRFGKIRGDYQIPKEFQNNFPEKIHDLMKEFTSKGFFPVFPFGTDLTPDEIFLGKALKSVKGKSKPQIFGLLLKGLLQPHDEKVSNYLSRIKLLNPENSKLKIMKLIIQAQIKNQLNSH